MTSNHRAIVTGASGTIGRKIVANLRRRGIWTLVVSRSAAPQAGLIVADLSVPGSGYTVMEQATARWGTPPTILIHAAGMMETGDSEEILQLNYLTPLLMTRMLIGPASSLFFCDATLGALSRARFWSYYWAKIKLQAGIPDLALTMLPLAVRVNALKLGYITQHPRQSDEGFERLRHEAPLRLPTAEELAELAVTIALAEGVTGQVIDVDGGARMVKDA